MKKKIFKISFVALLMSAIVGCKVEPIQPNELANSNNTTTVEEEAYTVPPCDLDSNKMSFDGYNFMLGIASVNPPFQAVDCANSKYFVQTSMKKNTYDSNPQKLNIYFLSQPKTGKYYVTTNNYLDPESKKKEVYLTVDYKSGYSTTTYNALEGTVVYVKKTEKEVKISFCESTFSYDNFTIKNSNAQLSVVE